MLGKRCCNSYQTIGVVTYIVCHGNLQCWVRKVHITRKYFALNGYWKIITAGLKMLETIPL
jgi:hypothetical protein